MGRPWEVDLEPSEASTHWQQEQHCNSVMFVLSRTALRVRPFQASSLQPGAVLEPLSRNRSAGGHVILSLTLSPRPPSYMFTKRQRNAPVLYDKSLVYYDPLSPSQYTYKVLQRSKILECKISFSQKSYTFILRSHPICIRHILAYTIKIRRLKVNNKVFIR